MLKNSLDNSPLIYKVKTTGPKFYLVKPNQGTMNINEEVEISIIIQPNINEHE
jgi:hypothetical protein